MRIHTCYESVVRAIARTFALVAPLLLVAPDVAAEPRPQVRTLAYDTRIDVSITAVGAIWWLATEVMKDDLVPEKCRWCYRADDGSDALNPYDQFMRERLRWKEARAADVASSVVAFVVQPGAALGLTALAAGHDGALGHVPIDALLVGEATMVAANVNQAAKLAFARERPFVHYMPRAPEGLRALTDSPSDDNLSFFSGHTTLAFALAASSGTVASLREYRLAPLVWAVGLPMAASVGYLRIAADKHYFSDVMTGAIVGTALGAGIPLLFHEPRARPASEVSVAPPPSESAAARTVFSLRAAW